MFGLSFFSKYLAADFWMTHIFALAAVCEIGKPSVLSLGQELPI